MSIKKISPFVYWAPRIISILFVIFLMMFSLDVFEMGLGFWGTVGALFMHNILAFILIAMIIYSWKKEMIGTIAFALFGFWYVFRLALQGIFNGFELYMLSWPIIIAGPAFLVSYLYLLNWRQRKSNAKKSAR